ncbi:MAG: class I SAM-dependent methyltransferase [Spirochaetales bacterium]|nr:class I SAM-dependent methyltransferase [Spirochaetales bacterium]
MYTASEQQLLLAVRRCNDKNYNPTRDEIEEFGRTYYCSFKLDWNGAFANLLETGDLVNRNDGITLRNGLNIDNIARRKPRYKYWYNDWYRLADRSKTHSCLCSFAYGIDLCQTGMMTKCQIDHLAGLLAPDGRGIDAGCGAGRITEYLYRKAHAKLTGVDTIWSGIRLARERNALNEGLEFKLGDMREFIRGAKTGYDFILSIDTLYFIGDDLGLFIKDCLDKLASGGKMHIFYSAWENKDNALGFDKNKLGKFLLDSQISFEYTDFTDDDISHWKKKKLFLERNRDAFIAEGREILYENRYCEANIFENLGSLKKMKRYLYTIFR